MQKSLLVIALAVTTALVACGREQAPTQNPAAPSAAVSGTFNAPADGTTLKATAPEPVSPVNVRVEDQPTLVYRAATGKFAQPAFTYRVELMDASNRVIETGNLTGLAWPVKAELGTDQEYKWRVRAEWNGAIGPWSASATFRSPDIPTGYNRGNEIYDPLTDGKSVGTIRGAHTFIPGVGVRLDGESSYIEYVLNQTLVAGEYSVIVSNLSTDRGGPSKSKVMGMSQRAGEQGPNDIVRDPRRMTAEKRPDGTVAWRFITSEQQIDTEGHERVSRPFHEDWTYLWRTTWNGAFTLDIEVLQPAGGEIYSFGKSYRGIYDPAPHFVFVGSPWVESGHGTVPGMIVRQVWVSSRPRPSWANK